MRKDAADREGMDISEQLRTWRAFTGFVALGAAGSALVAAFLIVLSLQG